MPKVQIPEGTFSLVASSAGDDHNRPAAVPCGWHVQSLIVDRIRAPPPAHESPAPTNAFTVRRIGGRSTGKPAITLFAPGAGAFRVIAKAAGLTFGTAKKRSRPCAP
jgi:hypothetical protein